MLTIYKSSAGAGKTFTLVGNYIDLLFSMHGKNRHRKILAVTFTKKATGEMKARILKELSLLATAGDSKYANDLKAKHNIDDGTLQRQATLMLNDILQDYSAFAVNTIDSFFQQIIRSFARELNLPGAYNLELDSDRIRQTAVDDFFFYLPADDNSQYLGMLLNVVEDNMEEGNRWNPKQTILDLSEELGKETYQEHRKELEAVLCKKAAIWQFRSALRQLKEEYINKYRSIEAEVKDLLDGIEESEFKNAKNVFAPFHWTERDILDAIKGKKTYTTLAKFVSDPQSFVKLPAHKSIAEALQTPAQRLLSLIEGEDVKLYVTATLVLEHIAYLPLLQAVQEYIQKANTELNRLPMSDTNALLQDVVSQQEESPFIYDKIGTRISHYMIDEFQDTSLMQWRNFRPLVREASARGESSMIVGDVKQSIYRWRNSDSTLLQYQAKSDCNAADAPTLLDNHRSSRAIVEANNHIFKLLSAAVQKEYTDKSKSESTRINDIYADLRQEIKSDKVGYVRMEFLAAAIKDEGRKAVAARLPDLVKDIKARGIRGGQIAFLIRNHKDAQLISDTLLAADIPVTSAEGLYINSSAEVRLLIDMLRLSLTPDDEILRFMASYEYNLLSCTTANEALQKTLSNDTQLPVLPSAPTLEEQVAAAIRSLGLDKREQARPYLQALQDKVYAYTSKYAADLYSFLEWWQEKGDKASIQMQQTDDAVQIVTIHKSKGLEYDVVIVPFCDWDGAKVSNNHKNILWVKPKTQPFDSMPVLPVNFSKEMAKSLFFEEYNCELENLYIDNLNLTYVAFTRPKQELYVFAPDTEKETKNDKSIKTDNMGGMLRSVLQSELQDGVYERGERGQMMAEEQQAEEQIPYETTEVEEHAALQIKLPSRDYFLHEGDNGLQSRVNLGSLMHEVLCQVVHSGDETKVVQRMVREGKLTDDDLRIVETELKNIRELVSTTDWFSDKWQVINEQDILKSDGSARRPDRLMLCGKQAVIVDWKFGYVCSDDYVRQVREYMHLLGEMGYEPEGWICYVSRREMVRVDI